jgi:hypothetical protein
MLLLPLVAGCIEERPPLPLASDAERLVYPRVCVGEVYEAFVGDTVEVAITLEEWVEPFPDFEMFPPAWITYDECGFLFLDFELAQRFAGLEHVLDWDHAVQFFLYFDGGEPVLPLTPRDTLATVRYEAINAGFFRFKVNDCQDYIDVYGDQLTQRKCYNALICPVLRFPSGQDPTQFVEVAVTINYPRIGDFHVHIEHPDADFYPQWTVLGQSLQGSHMLEEAETLPGWLIYRAKGPVTELKGYEPDTLLIATFKPREAGWANFSTFFCDDSIYVEPAPLRPSGERHSPPDKEEQ